MRYFLMSLLLFVPAAVSATGAGEAAVKDPDAQRCRTIKEVGSRIPKRECKTNAEWARVQAEAREAMASRNRASHCLERC